MLVKLLRGMVVNKRPYRVGDEVFVNAADGESFIKNGKAIEVSTTTEPAQATSKKRRGRPPKQKIED